MLPSITAKSGLLLLACVIGAASATGGGNAREAVLPETTMTDAGVTVREAIKMTLFNWTYSETETATHLTICTENLLIAPEEVDITSPTLVYMIGDNQTDIEGEVLAENKSCSLFSQDGRAPLAKSKTLYRLYFIVKNSTNITIVRSGSVTFAMKVETSTLYCNGTPYTRATGLRGNETFQLDHPCMNNDLKLGVKGVCYLNGEFSVSSLCYTPIKTDLRVCLQGSSLVTAVDAGQHSVSHLAYKGVPGKTDAAHLSLGFDDLGLTGAKEALIWKQGKSFATATSCQNNVFPIPDFTSEFARYDVCAVTFGSDDRPINTSHSSITDLNAHAVVYNGSPLLQFDYTNGNENGYYIAYVENNDKNVTVDCSGVPLSRTCHGFFEEECTADVIIAIEYANAAMCAAGNKIMFPCPQADSGRG